MGELIVIIQYKDGANKRKVEINKTWYKFIEDCKQLDFYTNLPKKQQIWWWENLSPFVHSVQTRLDMLLRKILLVCEKLAVIREIIANDEYICINTTITSKSGFKTNHTEVIRLENIWDKKFDDIVNNLMINKLNIMTIKEQAKCIRR